MMRFARMNLVTTSRNHPSALSFMKISSFSVPRLLQKIGGVAASVVLLGLTLQPAQAQTFVPAPNGDNRTKWVAVDDQIVPAGAVTRGHAHDGHAHKGLSPLSLAPYARKWPQGRVAYAYNDNMSASKRALFERACREWEKYAGLHFTPRASEANYIVVTSTANSSNSPIGMVGGGQILNLADWANHITAIHELAHALGIIHEQSRSDRDTYVTIHPENISDGTVHNFDKIDGSLNQGPYDFDSMMHYFGTAFSKNGQPTITANAPYTEFQGKMGQRDHLSEGDKKGMALIYGSPGPNGRGIIKPESPKTKDVLTATPTGKGAPASYRYKWLKNGQEIVGETSNTLDLSVAGKGDRGDIITVLIDGPDEQGVASIDEASVKILNSAPKVLLHKADEALTILDSETLRRQLTGTDDDNDALSFILVTDTENGVLNLEKSGAFTYKSNADFEGTDGFKAAATDGQTAGLPETFSIEVEQDNEAPVLNDIAFGATLGFAFNASLRATDANNDELIYQRVGGTLPAGLRLSNGGVITGTPTQVETTVATIRVYDGHGATVDAQVTIEVKPEDTSPTVRVTFTPKAPKTNDVLIANIDVRNPVAGAVTAIYRFRVNGKLVKTSQSNTLDLSRADRGDKGDVITCNVTITNEKGSSATADAEVTVQNSAPVASNGSGVAQSDVTTVFTLGGSDPDNDAITFRLDDNAANGSATLRRDEDGQIKLFYRSNRSFKGTDVVRFNVSDGNSTSNAARFTLTVKDSLVNRAPVASDMSLNAYVGESLTKALRGSDADDDALTFRIVDNARYGKSRITRDANGRFVLVYTSPNKFYASDRVTYIAIDSQGAQSKPATITLNFVNRAPVATSGSLTVASGESVSQLLVAEDADNDALSFQMVGKPRYGTGEVKRDAKGVWRVDYQSNAGYVGEDRIKFIAIDAAGNPSAPAIITITVGGASSTTSASGAMTSNPAPSAGGS